MARVVGSEKPVMLSRELGRDERPARDRPAIAGADEDLLVARRKRLAPLLTGVVARPGDGAAEAGRAPLVLWEREVDVDQLLDLVFSWAADLVPVRNGHVGLRRHLPDP